jgi:hypothetical protein
VHAGSPAEALKDANDGGGDIDLPGIGAMPGAGWIGVVHIVPAFAEGEQSERPQVGGAVVAASGEGAGADHVAQRVDAPGDVLKQGDADQSGPQQGGQAKKMPVAVRASAAVQPFADESTVLVILGREKLRIRRQPLFLGHNRCQGPEQRFGYYPAFTLLPHC